MIYYKTEQEIDLIRESSLLVGKTLAEVAKILKEGVTGLEVDKLVEVYLKDHQASASFKGFEGYPYSICFSVNEQVVHGFPTSKPLKNGDVVSVDIGAYLNGYHGDYAYTFIIGETSPERQNLVRVTKECVYKGIEKAVSGLKMGDLGYAIQKHAESNGFSVVRELVGHGLGKSLHEAPSVPNYGSPKSGVNLKDNLVIAIEPMINQGKRHIYTLKDGWTIVTKDGLASAHFEHNVVVRKGKAEVLSTYSFVEEEIKKNINLTVL